jgi:hypothetical protein
MVVVSAAGTERRFAQQPRHAAEGGRVVERRLSQRAQRGCVAAPKQARPSEAEWM